MKVSINIFRSLAFIIITMLIMPVGMPAQDSGEPALIDWFSKEELAQMLAPIALYPDSLIAQILMASTYPLEVVEAERWVQHNSELKGEALNYALLEKPWDPSIKSLCHFPDILIVMSEQLDLTRKLGDAFLSQEDDVMDTIQLLRRKAEKQGNLRTTGEQTVIIEREIIRIEPADPRVVYVPIYNPVYVYGPWWYQNYPPYYWYYPPNVIITGGFISFGPRLYIGFDLFSWSWFDWHTHHIYVDVHKARRFHRSRHSYASERYFWQHDPRHRGGVAYRDKRTGERYGYRIPQRSKANTEMRRSPILNDKRKAVVPSRDSKVRTERTAKQWVRTEREKIQKPDERRARVDTPKIRTETIQRPNGRNTPFRENSNSNIERKAGKNETESRQAWKMGRKNENTKHQDEEQGYRGQGRERRGGVFHR